MLLDQLIYQQLFELSAYGVQELKEKEKKVEIKNNIAEWEATKKRTKCIHFPIANEDFIQNGMHTEGLKIPQSIYAGVP